MKIRHPLFIHLAALGITGFVRMLGGSQRFTYYPLGGRITPSEPGLTQRYLYTFWHETLLLPASAYCGLDIRVLISKHADGEIIARAVERLGYRPIRGSTTRGGLEAVREILALNRQYHVVITPDGPRGPRRIVQGGAVYVASRTRLPLVPVGVGYDQPWRAKSWDRFAVPRPFRRAVLVTGHPILVPHDAGREQLEQHRLRHQAAMDDVTEMAERMAAGYKPATVAAAA